jgi:hypothetical protein
LGDSRLLVSSTCKFSGNPSGALSSVTVSNGVITFNGVTNAVIGNQYVFQGFSAPYTELNGMVLTVSATDGSSYWSATILGLAPIMTSYTLPSGTASASSEYDSGHAAWHAFNPAYVDGWAGSGVPNWLQYQFPTAQTLTSYSVLPGLHYPDGRPTAWTFEGSNNGSSWTPLDAQSGITTQTYFTISSPGAYVYYRIDITADAGNANSGIGRLILNSMPDGSPSITGVTGVCRNTAPSQIAYSKLFQDSGVPVVNMGLPAGTLADALANYDTRYHSLTPIVTGHPAIFILHYDQDFSNGDSATDYVSNINAILTKFWADGAQVVVDMPTPYGYNAYQVDVDTQAAQARILLTAEAPFISSQNNSLLVDVDSLGSMNNPNDSNYYMQGGCCGHHPTDLWATTLANATVQAIQTNTNLIASDPVVGVNISTGLQYQAFIDSSTNYGLVFGENNVGDGAISNGIDGFINFGGRPTDAQRGGLHVDYRASTGTFEVTIPGGLFSGNSQGCYGFRNASNIANQGCMSFDDDHNMFSFDRGNPNDHQGSTEAHEVVANNEKAPTGTFGCGSLDPTGKISVGNGNCLTTTNTPGSVISFVGNWTSGYPYYTVGNVVKYSGSLYLRTASAFTAPIVVQTTSAWFGASVTTSSSVTSGNALYLITTTQSTADASAPSDSLSSVWTKVASQSSSLGPQPQNVTIFCGMAISSGVDTVSWTPNGGGSQGQVMEVSSATCSVDTIRTIVNTDNPLATNIWTALPYDAIVVGAFTTGYGSTATGATIAQYNGGQSWIGSDVNTLAVGPYFEGLNDGRIGYDPMVIVAFKNSGIPSTDNPTVDTANWTAF